MPLAFSYAIKGGQLQLSWPQDHTGWRLQAQTNSIGHGLGTNWFDISSNLVVNTNAFSIPIGTLDGGVFFRMIYNVTFP